MISIILMEPEHPGNIGACARIMANFNIRSLYIVNPKVDHLDPIAIARSKHAKDILKRAKVISKEDLKKFSLLVATSAKLGSDYNIKRTPLTPEQLAVNVNGAKGRIGILLGRESYGLTNEEIKSCDFIVTIPSFQKYSVLNISQACGVICYELFKHSKTKKRVFELPNRSEKETIMKKIYELLDSFDFPTIDKKETQKVFWKRLISKSFITKREIYIIFGFLKRIKRKIDQKL